MKRITGLDPAGPLFGKNASERLDKNDAEFVDIIHTDKILGLDLPIGHADFYPNGGESQPSCSNKTINKTNSIHKKRNLMNAIESVKCSHAKSVEFFIQSINSNCKFFSISCSSYQNYLNSYCICKSNINYCFNLMGYYAKKSFKNENEKYFLKTSNKRPYCL